MLLQEAIEFAVESHKGHFRRYEGVSYVTHPMAVMGAMTEFTNDEAILSACVLHDAVEDCEAVDIEVIHERFGEIVAGYVFYATEKSKKIDGNRAVRKEIDRRHYSAGTSVSQDIKVLDMINNMPTITLFSTYEFADTYLSEKLQLLGCLRKCNPVLKSRASQLIGELYLLLERLKCK